MKAEGARIGGRALMRRALATLLLTMFSVMGTCVAMCYDIDTGRFHVTVSLAAGRGVSGPRRLARSNIGSLTDFYIYILIC